MARVTMTLLLLLAFLAAVVLLQIFLCRRPQKWPGLVLPGICALFSLVAVLNVAALVSMENTILAVLTVLVLYNIPTAVRVLGLDKSAPSLTNRRRSNCIIIVPPIG